jgi:glycerol-3-phosphate acyltransferase PlsY
MLAVLLAVGRLAASALAGYVCGSIPSGVVVGRLFGDVDPRDLGSGKTGATNVMRTLGPGPAVLVAVGDVMKGVAPILLARYLIFPAQHATAAIAPWAETAAGYAALLGHNHSMFIGFKGGRGVATGGGASLAMQPLAVVVAVIGMIVPVAITRYVSLGSIVAAATCATADAVLVALRLDSYQHLAFMVGGAAIIIYAHRDNIARLAAGTERKLGQKES